MKKLSLILLAFSSIACAQMKLETIFSIGGEEVKRTYPVTKNESVTCEYSRIRINVKVEGEGDILRYTFSVLHDDREVGTEEQTRNRGDYAIINCVEQEKKDVMYQFSARVVEE